MYHASLHTNAYYNYVNSRLRLVAGDKAAVEATLYEIRLEILLRSSMGERWDLVIVAHLHILYVRNYDEMYPIT